MKQIRRKVKKTDVSAAAQFLYENGITCILSYVEDELFATPYVVMELAVPADKETILNQQSIFRA